MIADLKPYAEYKESRLPWLGEVPRHWETRRLRHACDMRVSNVDKHTKVGETPVRLCNYVDVYKNDRIRESTPFMAATASEDERLRFGLRQGDVLITKDSEQWDDIGVPALVEVEAPDLICGYHLAILRARPGLLGAFLHRALESHFIAAQFHVEANGVTRYGLAHGAIQGLAIPLPPVYEQVAIARFLDWANGRLERAIRAKRKVIALLNEQKQAIIQRAVTCGLNPSVSLKPSGIPWLGDIPRHWEVMPLKYLCRRIQNGATPSTSEQHYYMNGTVPWFGPSSIGTSSQLGAPVRHLTGAAFDDGKARLISGPALLLIVIGATAGKMGLLLAEGATNQQITAFELLRGTITPEFGVQQLRSSERWLKSTASTATIPILDSGVVNRLPLAVPPLVEQERILSALSIEILPLATAICRLEREIELLREYRTRLVADVVTGKLDVRDAATRLPDEAMVESGVDDSELTDETDAADEEVEV